MGVRIGKDESELVVHQATLNFPFPIIPYLTHPPFETSLCQNTLLTNDQETTHVQRPALSVKNAWEQVGLGIILTSSSGLTGSRYRPLHL